MRTIVAPTDSEVQFEYVRVPKETQFGICDGHTLEVRFDGCRYHVVGEQSGVGPFECIDVESGEIVMLDVRDATRWFTKD